MSDLEPGLYVNPDSRGWVINEEPGWKSRGAFNTPPFTCADVIKRALTKAPGKQLPVFVLHPQDRTYTKVATENDIPAWCHSLII